MHQERWIKQSYCYAIWADSVIKLASIYLRGKQTFVAVRYRSGRMALCGALHKADDLAVGLSNGTSAEWVLRPYECLAGKHAECQPRAERAAVWARSIGGASVLWRASRMLGEAPATQWSEALNRSQFVTVTELRYNGINALYRFKWIARAATRY